MKSSLHITVAESLGKTRLQNCFVTPPFKVANITEDKSKTDLQLMIMSSSPGVLDTDEIDIAVSVKENAKLHLHTQSYQRLFPMQAGAKQSVHVNLDENASLYYLPHPSVPHKDAVFKSNNEIRMKASSSLLWGEIITCGRSLNDEVFQFKKFHSKTKIFIDDRLVLKENLLLDPATMKLQGIGHLEGFTHQASLIYFDRKIDIGAIQELIIEKLESKSNIAFGVSKTPAGGLLVRILGYKGEQLFDCLQELKINILKHHTSLSLQC